MKTKIEYFLTDLFREIISDEVYWLCVRSTLFDGFFSEAEELYYSLEGDDDFH